MAGNRIGKLYRHKQDMVLWETKTFLSKNVGIVAADCPMLILDKAEQFGDQWIYVLGQDIVGWANITYKELEWLDPECEYDNCSK